MALATVEAATPCCAATRPRLAYSRPAPPTRCAAMPTKFSGVHRAHAAFATRSRSFSSGTSAAAPLKPTAPANQPPPGAAISPARQPLPLDLQAKHDMPAAQPTRPPVLLPGGLDLRLSH